MRQTSQFATLLILACSVAYFLGYALLPNNIRFTLELKKIGLQYSTPPTEQPLITTDSTQLALQTDTLPKANDTIIIAQATEKQKNDSSRQRILFIGDSMLEGLSLRLNDYAYQDNNYLMTVIWYASGTRHWGNTDSLQMLIDKYKPTYIFISLGGNEIKARDPYRYQPYINNIITTCGDIPFIWIGPPLKRKNTGINELIKNSVGENRFFDSSNLKLKRKEDHIHPTYEAAAVWMDSIATWVSSQQVQHPIKMTKPTQHAKKRNLRVFKRAT